MSVKKHPEYLQGLVVVPILMLSKIFLGIYYNLSIWYKLTNKNSIGAVITIVGALITLLINYLLIPSMGFLACAWATVACYGTMMLDELFHGAKTLSHPIRMEKSIGLHRTIDTFFTWRMPCSGPTQRTFGWYMVAQPCSCSFLC